MSDAFISYARKDAEFVRRLHDALERAGKDTWVDWQDIPPTADWMAEIYDAIEGANAFVFVLSPEAVSSQVCARELAHAASQNKRVIPLLCRDVDPRGVPAAAARHQWISFANDHAFEDMFAQLVEALDTDLEWVAAHTRWLLRARDWEGKDHDKSLLLRGGDLRSAEDWLAGAPGKAPEPTALHNEYVNAGRRAASRRQRALIVSVSGALLVSLALGTVALIQRGEARSQTRLAQSQALTAKAELVLPSDPVLSGLLAKEAIEREQTVDSESMLARALARMGWRSVMYGHTAQVIDVAYSADGRQIVSASRDGTVRVWNPTTGKPIRLFRVRKLKGAALSPDGTRLVVARIDRTARILDVSDGRQLRVLRGHREDVESATFSPDGNRIVTASLDRTARIWDASDGRELEVLRGHSEFLETAVFSGDGERVVTASGDSTARVWEASTGRMLRVLRHRDGVSAAVFSPGARRVVTAGYDGRALIWDVGRGRAIETLRGDTASLSDASFSSDGRRVVTAGEGAARVWGAGSGTVAALRGHTGEVSTAAFSPDGKSVATGGTDRTIRIWRSREPGVLRDLPSSGGPVAGAQFAPDGKRVLVAAGEGEVRIWDAPRGDSFASPRAIADAGNALGPNGQRLARGWLRRIAPRWKTVGGDAVAGTAGDVNTIAFGPDGKKIVTADLEGRPRIWNATSGRPIVSLGRRGYNADTASFSPDGKRVVTTNFDEEVARIWDAASGREARSLRGHRETPYSAAFSPDGDRIVTASFDRTARIWDAASGRTIRSLRGHREPVNSAVFSPDGRRIVTASADNTARIWDAASGRAIVTLQYGRDPESVTGDVESAAFSPDGRQVVTGGGDGTARIWRCEVCRPLPELLELVEARTGRELTPGERKEYLPE